MALHKFTVFVESTRIDSYVVIAETEEEAIELATSGDIEVHRAGDEETVSSRIDSVEPAPVLACGHSACTQHYIDTGATACIHEED